METSAHELSFRPIADQYLTSDQQGADIWSAHTNALFHYFDMTMFLAESALAGTLTFSMPVKAVISHVISRSEQHKYEFSASV